MFETETYKNNNSKMYYTVAEFCFYDFLFLKKINPEISEKSNFHCSYFEMLTQFNVHSFLSMLKSKSLLFFNVNLFGIRVLNAYLKVQRKWNIQFTWQALLIFIHRSFLWPLSNFQFYFFFVLAHWFSLLPFHLLHGFFLFSFVFRPFIAWFELVYAIVME